MTSVPFTKLLGGLCSLFLAALLLNTTAHAAEDAVLQRAYTQLATGTFQDKGEAVAALGQLRPANTQPLLTALLEGNLYARSADGRLFIGVTNDTALTLQDAQTLQPAGSDSADKYSRITTNNQLRKAIKGVLAGFVLADPDVNVRFAAVTEMLRSLDDDNALLLRQRVAIEPDREVKRTIATGLALADLDNADATVRAAALATLQGSLSTDVYNRVKALAGKAEDGNYNEPDTKVRATARALLDDIDSSRRVYAGVETLFFGLSLGSVLVLAAIGLAITFGVMGVINMAHGELIMLGAYTTYVIQLLLPEYIAISVLIAIPAAFAVSGLVGVLIERSVVKYLYGRPLETLLATFGISLLLQQAVRDTFSPNNRPVKTPEWMSGSLQINEALSITYNRLYVVLFMLVVFAILLVVLKYTNLGLRVRAVAQNRAMAKAMGVRTDWVDALTFGLGSGIAGVAGVALSQLTNVGPNLGQQYIIDSFMVVVFGGVGNLWGTLIGGMSLGVANQVLEPFSGAVLAKILVLITLILFIQRRPRGLFPQKGRSAEA
jgi:urea transport system permease protein